MPRLIAADLFEDRAIGSRDEAWRFQGQLVKFAFPPLEKEREVQNISSSLGIFGHDFPNTRTACTRGQGQARQQHSPSGLTRFAQGGAAIEIVRRSGKSFGELVRVHHFRAEESR